MQKCTNAEMEKCLAGPRQPRCVDERAFSMIALKIAVS
jgi:hypothetical protein